MVSVPWVITMRSSGVSTQRSRMSCAAGIGHLQAVDHHEGFDIDVQAAAAEAEHVGEVGLLEEQFARELVVFLVEGAAGDEDADAHEGFQSKEIIAADKRR